MVYDQPIVPKTPPVSMPKNKNTTCPILQVTPNGWLLKFNDSTAVRSYDSSGLTTALLENRAFVKLALQKSIPPPDGRPND